MQKQITLNSWIQVQQNDRAKGKKYTAQEKSSVHWTDDRLVH